MASTTPTPVFSDIVDQSFFIEPLIGPKGPISYLDRFPDELYNKNLESRLVKFLYALIGPAGIAQLRQQYFNARLWFEEHGVEGFDIERFYASPFEFGRILDEVLPDDPTGLLDRATWDQIRGQDEAYRSRAVDFFNGARLGTTPEGMRLVARSGLGHDVEIIENYKYLFDINSGDPKGYTYLGQTASPNEFVVLPRAETNASEVHQITVTGSSSVGNFTVYYGGRAAATVPFNVDQFTFQTTLQAFPAIGAGNVQVTGGPGQTQPYTLTFTGSLSNQVLPDVTVTTNLSAGSVSIAKIQNAHPPTDQTSIIAPINLHNLQTAIDRTRPVGALVTTFPATGKRINQPWQTVAATSAYTEVIRYVTGTTKIDWPVNTDTTSWIQTDVENPAPRVINDRQHHYQAFHNVANATAYTDGALNDPLYGSSTSILANYSSTLLPPYGPEQASLFTLFRGGNLIVSPMGCLADFPEPLTVSQVTSDGTGLINGIYPTSYLNLSGAPSIQTNATGLWSSQERVSGDDLLEIDLGSVQAVNYLTFEITKKPIDIGISFDLLDQAPRRNFIDVTPATYDQWPNRIFPSSDQTPWTTVEFYFTNALGAIIFTRFLRLRFSRRDPNFIADHLGTRHGYSVDIRNLRVGRNVAS